MPSSVRASGWLNGGNEVSSAGLWNVLAGADRLESAGRNWLAGLACENGGRKVRGVRPLVLVGMQYGATDTAFALERGYFDILSDAGAVPVAVPPTATDEEIDSLLSACRGVVLPGGNDIDATLYGQKPLPDADDPVPLRDDFEMRLVRTVLARDVPFLGICRGMQLLNVAMGGTLVQRLPEPPKSDVPAEEQQRPGSAAAEQRRPNAAASTIPVCHWQDKPYDRPGHEVELVAGTPLACALTAHADEREDAARNERRDVQGDAKVRDRLRIGVVSLHHQAIDRLASGLRVAARADDGIIEAVWAPAKRFVWGVQWHPELMPQDPFTRRLACAFVEACKA
jgi:putative glutamine amidotransferase